MKQKEYKLRKKGGREKTTDPLIVFERFFTPAEGYTDTLLDEESSNGERWQLIRCHDVRYKPKPWWEFLLWKDVRGQADEQIWLKRDEIYGFLKARFPDCDTRQIIVEEVSKRLNNVIKSLK